jgi:transcription initiation factor TFIIE subunit alpha
MCKWRQFKLVDAFEDSFVRAASRIGGDDYAKVARTLARTEDVTDRELSSSTDIGLNKVRRVLYDLWGRCLIKGVRVKDHQVCCFVYIWRTRRHTEMLN